MSLSLLFVVGLVLFSQTLPAAAIDFEGLPDSTVLTSQIPCLTFANAIILTAGISLNEFEFPPHSGTNVASDNGGPMSILFSSPVQSFSGYFTYLEPLTVTAFGSTNNTLATAQSLFGNNLACLAGPPCSGDPGSSPNEFIQVSAAAGISSLTIAGDPAGASFVLDDAMVTALPSTGMPEPSAVFLTLTGAIVLGMLRRNARCS